MKWKFKAWLYAQSPNRLNSGQYNIYKQTGEVPISIRVESYHEGKRLQISTGISCSPDLLHLLYPEFRRSKKGIDLNKTRTARKQHSDLYSTLEGILIPYLDCVNELNSNLAKYQHIKTRQQFKDFKDERYSEIVLSKKDDIDHKLSDMLKLYLKFKDVSNEKTAENYNSAINHFLKKYANNENLTIWDIDYKWVKNWDKWAKKRLTDKSIETYANHLKIVLDFAKNIIPEYNHVPIVSKKSTITSKQKLEILKEYTQVQNVEDIVIPETNVYVIKKANRSSWKPNRYLDAKQIEILKKYWRSNETKSVKEQRALDVFFLLYYLAGCYPLDLLYQFKKDKYQKSKKYCEYTRHKTKNTATSIQPIPINLNSDGIELIERYKSHSRNKNLFNFLETARKPENEHNDFGDRHSKTLQVIGKRLGFSSLNCAIARHSHFNKLLKENIDIEKIRLIAGHTSTRTTRIYLDSLKMVDLTDAYEKL